MRRKALDLVWIPQSGGPLIAMPRPALMAWSGAERARDQATSDHDRACAMTGPCGVLDVHARKALVLGSELSLATQAAPEASRVVWTWRPSGDGGCFVARLEPGPAAAAALPSDATLAALDWQASETLFSNQDAAWLLFDAACPGWEIDYSCALHLPPGRYALATARTHDAARALQLVRVARRRKPRTPPEER